MSFIARYVYTCEEFVFVTEASAVQQNDSDRKKTKLLKYDKLNKKKTYQILFTSDLKMLYL